MTLSFPLAIGETPLLPSAVSSVFIWVALVPILMAIQSLSPKQVFRLGYLYGFFSALGIFYWFIIAMAVYGGISLWGSTGFLVLLAATLAFYPALAFYGAAKLRSRLPFWLSGSILFTLLLWSLTYFPFEGFPWISPAYALYPARPLIQMADIVGIPGINFLVLLMNFAIADFFCRVPRKSFRSSYSLHVAIGFTLVSALYGVIRLQTLSKSSPHTVRVAVIQGNIAQDKKWDEDYQQSIFEKYRRLTAQVSSFHPDLVVWPEAAIPTLIHSETLTLPFLAGIAGASDLVSGAVTYRMSGQRQAYFNSAFSVSPDGQVRSRYDKQHLVPFGEYVPLADLLPIRKIVPVAAGDFMNGEPRPPSHVGPYDYGILICYETLFPDLAIDEVRRGATFLVNITNDAWYNRTSGPYQHVHMGIFRAIETRRPIVRAANTGVSTIIDETGQMHQATPLFEDATLTAEIHPRTDRTWYVSYPHVFPAFLAIVLLVSASLGCGRRGRDTSPDVEPPTSA